MPLGGTAANQSGSLVLGALAILAGAAVALLVYVYLVPIGRHLGR